MNVDPNPFLEIYAELHIKIFIIISIILFIIILLLHKFEHDEGCLSVHVGIKC